MPAYLTTMYFVDPSIICAGGRTQEQFDSQGTGDRLVIQVGGNFVSSSSVGILREDECRLARARRRRVWSVCP